MRSAERARQRAARAAAAVRLAAAPYWRALLRRARAPLVGALALATLALLLLLRRPAGPAVPALTLPERWPACAAGGDGARFAVPSPTTFPALTRRNLTASAYPPALAEGRRFLIVSTYPPTLCGLATFSRALRFGLLDSGAAAEVDVLAMLVLPGDAPAYPPEVKRVLRRDAPAHYLSAARWANQRRYDAVLVQHEYGIFGGGDAAFLAPMLRSLDAPILLTMHTVLKRGSQVFGGAGAALVAAVDAHVVMSPGGCAVTAAWEDGWPEPDVLAAQQAIAAALEAPPSPSTRRAGKLASRPLALASAPPVLPAKARSACKHVPHGVPAMPNCDAAERAAAQAALLPPGRPPCQLLLLVGGLLGPGKGIEDVIAAMPAVLAALPDAALLVAGAPHPGLPSPQGYLQSLAAAARKAGVASAVHFLPGFLDNEQLRRVYATADIFLCAHTGAEQSSSGTMVMALSTPGLAVVATPFAQATELLAGGAGVMVPFRDPDAIADAVTRLADPGVRGRVAAAGNTAVAGRAWPAVGAAYAALADEAIARRMAANATVPPVQVVHSDGGAVGVANAAMGVVAMTRPAWRAGSSVSRGWAASEAWLLRDVERVPRGMAPPHALLLRAACMSVRQRRFGGRGRLATRDARTLDDAATRTSAEADTAGGVLLQEWDGTLLRAPHLAASVRRRVRVAAAGTASLRIELEATLRGGVRPEAVAWLVTGLDALDGAHCGVSAWHSLRVEEGPHRLAAAGAPCTAAAPLGDPATPPAATAVTLAGADAATGARCRVTLRSVAPAQPAWWPLTDEGGADAANASMPTPFRVGVDCHQGGGLHALNLHVEMRRAAQDRGDTTMRAAALALDVAWSCDPPLADVDEAASQAHNDT